MTTGIGFNQYLSFINCQLGPVGLKKQKPAQHHSFRAITLSRETGSGAYEIAEKLASSLQPSKQSGGRPWTVFDRELMKEVLKDHHLPTRMAEHIPEDRMTELQDAVEELFGLHPSSWTLIHQTSETILRLVELGNVILIGRGANLVTQHRKDVLHVQLIASKETRINRLKAQRRISRRAALELLRREDRGRARYLKKYFEADVGNPQIYHLTINTELIPLDEIVKMLTSVMNAKA